MVKKLLAKYEKEKTPDDTFFSWYFTKHASGFVKGVFIIFLYILWLRFGFDLVFMVYFFEVVFCGFVLFLLGLGVKKGVIGFFHRRKDKRNME